MLKAILFDLDMTLLDTSAVEAFRRSQEWDRARAHYHLVEPFEEESTFAHDLPRHFQERGFRVGIVTSSPRRYAVELATKFGIVHDVLVGYDDTDEHKPDPAPLTLAVTRLGLQPNEVAYVGDSPDDVIAAARAGMLSIGAGWGVSDWNEFRRSAPDVLFRNPHRFLETKELDKRRYFAEASVAGVSPLAHGGSMLSWDEPHPSYALGRYFPTADPRHATNKLSQLLLDFKTDDGPVPILAAALTAALRRSALESSTYIVSVPPKPSQVAVRDRFQSLFNAMRGDPSHGKIVPGGLSCLREVEDYKQMNPSQREIAVRGAFKSTYTWRDKRVLLIDDVYTTSATTAECARVLLKSSASSVIVLALGADQRSIPPSECPMCGSSVKTYRNKWDGTHFVGCTAYKGGCKYKYDVA